MKRLLFISLLPLSALAHAQAVTYHAGYVSHTATQGINGGGGYDGTPFSHYVPTTLNDDSGSIHSIYSHSGTASSVTYDATGQSKNSLDISTLTYAVDLSTSLGVNVALTNNGYVSLDAVALDRLEVHLDNPMRINLGWVASGDGSLDLYDASFNTLIHADLTSNSSASLVLPAGDYILLGAVDRYYNATGLFGFPGSTSAESSSLSYQANLQAVPEPSALAALGLGAVAFVRRRK